MLCLVARSNDKEIRIPVPASDARIGSSPNGSEIVLPFVGVSRTHALLTRGDAGVRLTDLGSKNGLLVDGVRVSDVLLGAGVRVQLGSALLSVEDRHTSDFDIAATVPPSPAALASDPQTATLLGRAGEAEALKLVADLERAGTHARAEEIVGRLCRILGAASVRLLVIADDVAIAAAAGVELSEAETARVVAAARESAPPDVVIERAGNASLLYATSRRRGMARALVAAFPGRPRAFAEWEKDFFGFVAGRLVRGEPQRRSDAAALPAAPGLVFESPAIRSAVETVLALSTSDKPILLLGETGTGKEVFARLLHDTGPFARGPFLAVSCSELPDSLLESELFGIDAGIATGVEARDGLFAAADGGTLFLDEIGEIGPAMQAALLRVLERREVRRVGARRWRPVRLRIVLATRRDVVLGGEGSGVRDDIYYRSFPIRVPPLRERPDDILPLALHFAERANGNAISRKAAGLLLAYDWPGNIRELEHAVQRAVLEHRGAPMLLPEHFPAIAAAVQRRGVPASPQSLKDESDALERARIAGALAQTDGNRTAAAQLLGVSRNGLAKKMRRLGIRN